MSVLLLTTKLFVPIARGDRVARPHLLARLASVLQPGRKVALLCAPAGFGKTSLLAEWVSRPASAPHPQHRAPNDSSGLPAVPRAVAWLSLDASDDEPIRFWTYVLAALDEVCPGIGAALQTALAAPHPPPLDGVITALINALATEPVDGVPLALMLDDYHLITAPAIHEQVQFLVERLPPSVRVVIATRADPPLPVARWRARDEVVEVRAAELRFSVEEATTFLTGVMGLGLGPSEVNALEARTEGWIAGLHLAGLAMRGRTDLPGFVASFTGSNRFVVDYLAEEIFRRQSSQLQAFLLQTSILERMCGPLCDAVIGTDRPAAAHRDRNLAAGPVASGQDTLEYLERSNLFTVQLDDERRWYRYHHLFHAALRERLRVELAAEEIAELHQRASSWLAGYELIPEAVEHALAAADHRRAAELVEQHGLWLIARGQRSQVLTWLDTLPAEVLHARPKLGHLHAVILIQTNQTATGEAVLAEVERNLDSIASDEERKILRGQVLMSRAVLAWYIGDPAAGTRYAQQASEFLPTTLPMSPAVAAMYAATSYRLTGDVTAPSEQYLRWAVSLGRSLAHDLGQVSPHAVSLISLGRMHTLQGRLEQAAVCYEQARDLLHSPIERWTGHGALASIAQAELRWEQNDLAEADQLVRAGLELMEGPTTAGAETLLLGVLLLARLLGARGDGQGALTALDAFDERARQRGFFSGLLARSAAGRARLSLSQGNLVAATRWADSTGLAADDEIPFLREDEYLTLARVLIAQQQIGPSLRLLQRALAAAEAGERWGSAIAILVLMALAYQAAGDRSAAMLHLERALRIGAPQGYVRVFVDEKAAILSLLQEARERQTQNTYVDRLLSALAAELRPPDTRGAGTKPAAKTRVLARESAAARLPEPMSEREIEVLRLIADGYSNQDIADTLVIALGTVKKHINNLYGKLAVKSRTQALLRARALDLL